MFEARCGEVREEPLAPAPTHPVWDLLEEKGLSYARDEDLVLRRTRVPGPGV